MTTPSDYSASANRPRSPSRPAGSIRPAGWQGRLLLGLVLNAVSWAASWSGETPLAHHSFFPLWLGYILLVDALTEAMAGTSLWTRGRTKFLALFIASIPLWWLFEAFNSRLHNWTYHTHRPYSWLEYRLEASLAFATVLPAIFATAELYRALLPSLGIDWGPRLSPARRGWLLVSAAGLAMVMLSLVWSAHFFPLVWIGVFILVDPIVRLLGGCSIAAQVEQGWWGTVWRLFAAGLTCGFFWEMWNWNALPKWTYTIHYADAWRLFEMPLLGYGGYLPFALECYALAMMANRAFGIWPRGYFRFAEPYPERA